MPDKTTKKYLLFAAIFLTAAIAILPIAYFGIPDTVDMPQHFKFANIYYYSLNNGDFFPSVADRENYGYGGIGNRFYPPLEYYFLAFLRIIVGNWYDTAWINFLFWMVLGCFGIYFWTRCWFSPKTSAVAAVFYIFIPIHLGHLYTSFNNFSEFAGASLLTFCFGFLTRIFQRKKWTDALGLAVFYALLILMHLPLTIIASICLAVYTILLWRKEDGIQPLIKSAAAAVCAFAASSFYWFGMLTELKWLQHASEEYSRGDFNYEYGFFPFFYHSVAKFGYSNWIVDLSVGLSVLFFATSIVYFIYKSKNKTESFAGKSIFLTVFPLGLFAFFMVTPLSRLIWQYVTPLQKIQFPMRWLVVTAMCGAIVAATAYHYLLKGEFLKRRVWIYSVIVLTVAICSYNFLYILHPMAFVPQSREKFENKVIPSPDAESFVYWWAIWSKPEALEIKEKVLAENRNARILNWEAENRTFEISEGAAENVRVATFYYPHWKATVNDVSVEVGKDENGAILIPVSAEKSTVKLYFQEPLGMQIASYLSIFTWLALFATILISSLKKLSLTKQSAPQLQEAFHN